MFNSEDVTHYVVDGEPMRMRSLRQIVSDVLEYGDIAYHMPVQDIVHALRKDGRKVEIFKSGI